MNFEFILKDLRPSEEEKEKTIKVCTKVINFLNATCMEENLDCEAMLVGSVAKNTWLSGKSDIDIFIHFPLSTDESILKEKGLELAYKTSNALNGKASEHYASHPYLTSEIDGFEIDFVPCYLIKDGSELKSAVDRTILHTRYIQANLSNEQCDEVLLLKRFMDCVGTYGSEFKTGGFAGYLCELLILEYGTFENTLVQAQNWKFGTVIDLENYNTEDKFKDPLITIDPTDKNRNVGAALRLEKMVEFIIASRNFIDLINDNDLKTEEKEERIKKFFKALEKAQLENKERNEIIENIKKDFKDHETQTLAIKFNIPEISADSLHPQLFKTVESLSEKLMNEEFSVFKYDYWTNENDFAVFILELNVFKQSKYIIHEGPKIWAKKACDNFKGKWEDATFPNGEFLVIKKERKFKTATQFIKHVLTKEHIRTIKVGKGIKESLCNDYELLEIDEFLDHLDENINKNEQFELLNKLDDFLNPGQYLKR